MKSAVKLLEEIGQSASLKDYENIQDMLQSLNINSEIMQQLESDKQEYVCGLFPEDDEEEEEEQEQQEQHPQ